MREKLRKIMKKAVQIAKKMKGDWIARMKIALKIAWADERGQVGKDQRVENIRKVWEKANEILEAPDEVKEEFEEMINNKSLVSYFYQVYQKPTIVALYRWMNRFAENDDEVWDYFTAEEFDEAFKQKY